MYCSTCGGSVAQGLSYCNYCGAKLSAEKADSLVKSSDVKPGSVMWGMIAVLVFGFVAMTLLMMAMKMVGFNVGQILAFTILSFILMLLLEGVFIWQLVHGKRRAEQTDSALLKEQAAKELDAAQARMLPEARLSVTEHTTRSFEPIYRDRKSE
jgi:hypothetical protein